MVIWYEACGPSVGRAVKGKAANTVFWNRETGVRCVAHGDDFTFLGEDKYLDEVEAQMGAWYDIKVRGRIGADAKDQKEITILNRELKWDLDGLKYAADPKHVKIMMEATGLTEESKQSEVPGLREDDLEKNLTEGDQKMPKDEATGFRSIAARGNYLAQDRPDIQFSTNRLCKNMAEPLRKNEYMLKKLGRYLRGVKTAEYVYADVDESELERIDVYTDSDWAGCRKTRKSVSGGMVAWAGGFLKSWSKTQSIIATSSGEAEYYALAKGLAEAIGIRSLAADLGFEVRIRVWVDSSAAKSMATRTGLGKVRHMDVRYLWVQDVVRGKDVHLKKIAGERNPADILTKIKNRREMAELLLKVGVHLKIEYKMASPT